MKRFNVNQIVKGVSAGTFAVLGYRKIAGVEYVQLKEVNPDDYSEFAVGELALPEDCLMEIV
tara:strand:+ start:317 stop:502 length:186 start_codon:yes stop_codon:yes gene_type:complete